MNTVGIITTFRQSNFGSVLQAFSLQKVIDKLGYQSKVIDYKYPNEFHYERGCRLPKPKPLTYKRKIKSLIKNLLEVFGFRTIPKMKLLNYFIDKEMNCTRRYISYYALHNDPPLFDIYISGSDQIWNPHTMFGDMSYFFDFAPEGSKIISYSSSFSCDSIPENYQDQYKHHLARYSAISVRESNGVKIVEELTGRKDTKLVLDPTLLLDKNEWIQLAKKSRGLKTPKKYILCYMLAYTYNPNDKMKELLKFVQDKYQLPIVSLSPIKDWDGGEYIRVEKKQSVGIYEFIKLFADAEIVVTSSFHGTAFALNFGKPFFALQNGKSNSDDRISSLLSSVYMTTQLVTTETQLNDTLSPYYNVDSEQIALEKKRESSLNCLSSAINKIY